MKLKYVIKPGWVISKTDGDRHYIGVSALKKLYGVKDAECVVDDIGFYNDGDLIVLRPRYDGNFELPNET